MSRSYKGNSQMSQGIDSLFSWLGQLVNPTANLPKGQRFLAILALLQVAVVPFVIEYLPKEKRIFTIYSVTGLFILLLAIIFLTNARIRKLIDKSRKLMKSNRELKVETSRISEAIDNISEAKEKEKEQFKKLLSSKEKHAEDNLFSKIILLLEIKGKLLEVNRNASQMLANESISSRDMRKIQDKISNLLKELETQLKAFSEREIRMAEARELERETEANSN